MKGRKTMKIDGVCTTNFPYEIIDGEEHYQLHSAVVVEQITEGIPTEAKPAVTVDFEKIPDEFHRLVRTKMGMRQLEEMNEEEAREHQEKLIDLLNKEDAFLK